MKLLEDVYPLSATFPIAGGTCFIRFFINWHLNGKGHVEIVSFEPQHEVNGMVWVSFLVWAETQRADWTRIIDGVVEDARHAQNDWLLSRY
jgi:hypothetical protein